MYHDIILLQLPAAKNDDDDDGGDYGHTNNDGGYVGGTYLLHGAASFLRN
jgi:hypothetical protein